MSNNTIILKRSSVTGKKPTESQLQYGELSINYADGELYYKSSDNTIKSIGQKYGEDIETLKSGKLDVNGTALKATSDASGNNIVNTYIKGLSVNGKVITYTKGNGDTGTITTQDTTYGAATSSTLGLVKTGSNITNTSGTISLTKANVTNALGYTPPTTDTTYSAFVGASASADGSNGLVPTPTAGKQDSFLRGDGTWATPLNTTYTGSDGISLTGTNFTNSGVRSIASGTTANTLSVNTGGTSKTLTIDNVANATKATSADKLSTARTITLGGDLSGSVSFDGSENVTLTATVSDDSHNHTIANIDNLQTTLDAKAPLASPSFTGTPTAPTADEGTNTTQVATTQFVQNAMAKCLPLAGGTMTGALNMGGQHINGANYVYAQWYSIGASIASSTAAKEILIKQGGWIYSRTPSQILSDIGAASASEVATLASRVSALEADFSNFMTKTEYQNEVDTAYAAIS